MFQWAEKVKIYIIVHWVWRLFPQLKWSTLRLFQATEDDSSWQLLRGVEVAPKAEQKAELFAQAMEEAYHAQCFRELYKSESTFQFYPYQSEKKLLYANRKDHWKLPIYCWVGEKSAAQRFQNIVNVSPSGRLKKTLKQIVADEVGHIHKAEKLIQVEGADPLSIQKEIQSIKRKRLWQGWKRSGRQITGWILQVLLFFIYWVFAGPFALMVYVTSSRFFEDFRLRKREVTKSTLILKREHL